MRWLKENSFLLGLAATTILAGGALVFLMMHSMTQYRETREAYTQAVRKLHALQNRSPFPNAENFEKSRALEEQYKSELDSLRARLAIETRKLQHRIKIRPQKFQDDLRTAVNRIAEKAGAAGVELPKGFYLGFSQYANSLPNEHAAPVLARQLGVIEKVVADLIGFKVQSIDGLTGPPCPRNLPPSSKRPKTLSSAAGSPKQTQAVLDASPLIWPSLPNTASCASPSIPCSIPISSLSFATLPFKIRRASVRRSSAKAARARLRRGNNLQAA